MPYTIKEILNNVLAESGFLERSQFFNSADPDDKQMCAIANRVQKEIKNFYPWTELRLSHTIILNGVDDTYDMPVGFIKLIPNSMWETDGSRRVDVPVRDTEWYQYKFSSLTTGGIIRAKFYGNTIEFIDSVASESVTFEYISTYAVSNSENVQKENFTKDEDTWLLDDQVLTLGIQAHWQQSKMMPSYQEHMLNYRGKMNEAISNSNQAQTIGGNYHQGRRSPYTKLWV